MELKVGENCKKGEIKMWNKASYEIVGRAHIKSEMPCQDKTFVLEKNGVDVIALSDGAGSAKFSHFGAQVIVEEVAEFLVNNFENLANNSDGNEVKKIIIENILEKLEKEAIRLSCSLDDLAGTAMFVAIKGDTSLIFHIGDGVIGYFKGEEIKVASAPTNGEFINSTTFVTSKSALQNAKLIKTGVENIKGFVLMSDGTAESFYDRKEKGLSSVLKKIMDWNSSLSREEMSLALKNNFDNVIRENSTDDCSIAIATIRTVKIEQTKNFSELTVREKASLLKINLDKPKYFVKNLKAIRKIEILLSFLKREKTLKEVTVFLQLEKKYSEIRLKNLIDLELISKDGKNYIKIN